MDDKELRLAAIREAILLHASDIDIDEALANARKIVAFVEQANVAITPKIIRGRHWPDAAKEYLREAYSANTSMWEIKRRLAAYGIEVNTPAVIAMAARLGVARPISPEHRARLGENIKKARAARAAKRAGR